MRMILLSITERSLGSVDTKSATRFIPPQLSFLQFHWLKDVTWRPNISCIPLPREFFLKKRRHCNVSIWEWNALRACFESVSNVFVFGKESEKSKLLDFWEFDACWLSV